MVLAGLLCFWAGPVQAQQQNPSSANVPLLYDYYPPQDALYNMVADAFKKEPAFKEYIKNLEMVPDFKLAAADLNGDDVAELFVQLKPTPMEGGCSPEGEVCPLFVYVRSKAQLVQIGRLMVGGEQELSVKKVNGLPEIYATDLSGANVRYTWNGRRYEAK